MASGRGEMCINFLSLGGFNLNLTHLFLPTSLVSRLGPGGVCAPKYVMRIRIHYHVTRHGLIVLKVMSTIAS